MIAAHWLAIGLVLGVPIYLLRMRSWKRLIGAVAVAFAAVWALAPDRKQKTPVDVAAVPPASPDAGADAGEGPHSMLAEPSEDEQRKLWESRGRNL